MKNMKKKLAAGIVLCATFITGAFARGSVISAILCPDITVNVDGSAKTFYDANGDQVYPISYNNTTYLPIRAIGGLMGKTVGWDESTQTISLDDAESATDTSYGRTNPAPVGTSQAVTVNNDSQKYTAVLTVTDVMRGAAAWEKIKAANQFNDEPAEGKEYILAKIKATVTSAADDKSVDFSGYNFDAFSSANAKYPAATVVEPDPEFDGSVYKDGTIEGYAAFLVDTSDTAPKLVYGARYDGTGGVWFSLVAK